MTRRRELVGLVGLVGAIRRRPAVLGWLLGLATAALVLVNQQEVGIARDEVVYMQAASRYAAWWTGLLDHGISERSVTQTFGGPGPTDNNREHPALMKTLFGLSERVLHQRLGVDEVTAFRAPAALIHGALVAIVFGFALELWGLAAALAAALCLIGLPRAVFHAGLACFDAPIMALWFATVVAYARAMAEPARRWPWQVGVLWGLALATKHTALLLPFALGAHYLIVGWRQARPATGLARLRAMTGHRWRVIVSLAVCGPVTLYVVWPWLWFAPIAHVRDWLAFHLNHVHYNYEYLGHNWNAPRFPWHVALVTTLFTVPVATLVAAAIGGVVWLTGARREGAAGDGQAPVLLLVLSFAASIGPFVLGTTPIFGSEKHWMPALPSLAIAAGVGIAWSGRRLAALVPRVPAAAVIGGLTAAVALAAAAELSVAEPYALTWYNALAGGAPGGAELGMNRQFWGVSARGVLSELGQLSSGRTYVYTHDASPAWGVYQREGQVSRDLVDAGLEQPGIDRSQLAIVVHELHFNRHDFMIWSAYGTVAPVFVLTSSGVPIVSVYRRPPR
ncbi:MAG TPA: glycosyltransferase family 39 protein [Kofleriaceae bacterium]